MYNEMASFDTESRVCPLLETGRISNAFPFRTFLRWKHRQKLRTMLEVLAITHCPQPKVLSFVGSAYPLRASVECDEVSYANKRHKCQGLR